MEYKVIFVQNHEYYVDAEDEDEAEKKAYAEFKQDMTRRSRAHDVYDDVIIEDEE